jgi:hypothetical protein
MSDVSIIEKKGILLGYHRAIMTCGKSSDRQMKRELVL